MSCDYALAMRQRSCKPARPERLPHLRPRPSSRAPNVTVRLFAECFYLETYPRLSGTQSKLAYSMSIADHGRLSTLSHGEFTYGPETF